MLTRSNIAHDLSISPHRMIIEYSKEQKIEYVFSSELYKNKFIEDIKVNRDKISESLSNRFGFAIVCDVLSDLFSYKKRETRGFLIYQNEEEFICLEQVKLDGQMLTKNS